MLIDWAVISVGVPNRLSIKSKGLPLDLLDDEMWLAGARGHRWGLERIQIH